MTTSSSGWPRKVTSCSIRIYGQDFGNVIQYHYPGDDYKDLMAGVDEVLRRGYVDEKKLGVTAGGGGGLLTNWVVGQTNRFAAAVTQRDIASWAHWWYTADFTLFQPNWFKAPPFEDEQDFKGRSPITYIKNVRTPMMFILGENDYRTPPGAGGEEMFRALKFRKIPTVMVRFPNESHELSRSGQPWHRVERLQHIVGWFDHWLIGVPKAEYKLRRRKKCRRTQKLLPQINQLRRRGRWLERDFSSRQTRLVYFGQTSTFGEPFSSTRLPAIRRCTV